MQIPHFVIVAGFFAVGLGASIGLYVLLTQGRRRSMREIRAGASDRKWKFRLRRWQGDPTAFRIDGRTGSGLNWVLTTTGTGGHERGWTVRLGLRVPTLGGEVDLAVLPRNLDGRGAAFPAASISPEAQARVAAISGTAASALGFCRAARELPSGLTAFDTAYQVLALPHQIRQPPIDAPLAERYVHWPVGAVAPHSVLAWRDPFGFHLQARLPAPANWVTVSYFLALAEDFCARLPSAATSPAPAGFLDRLIARFVGA